MILYSRTWIAVCAIAIGYLALTAPTASVANSQLGLELAKKVFSSSNPEAAYQNLNKSEQESVRNASLLHHSQLVGTSLVRDGSCWHQEGRYEAKALPGNTLFEYKQTTEVCRKQGKVFEVKVTKAGWKRYHPGWRLPDKPVKTVKNVSWEGRGNARFHFLLKVGPLKLQDPVLCVQMRLNVRKDVYEKSNSCNLG